MVISSNKALDHLGSLQWVLMSPIYRLRLAQGSKVSLSAKALPSARFPMCK
jgi:hypothetical protein